MKTIFPLTLLTCSILAGCSSTTQKQEQTTAVKREEAAYLTQAQAEQRSARVSNVDYQMEFVLDGSETFTNKTHIDFDLSDNKSALTIDLNEAKVSEVVVNGKPVSINYNNWFITIEAADLQVGRNQVDVNFTRKHSTNGEGLHRMQDPVDGKVYLYSHFEPAAANQMFALFDQPDLKANYEMKVTAPKDWYVFTAMKETRVQEEGKNNVWYFDKTLKLSPYNFSLHAGPYHQWTDNSGKYPLRLFARQSVVDQVEPNDWFAYTHQGIKFFEHYYGIDYPFRKYDQVIVPDFLYGAMENAAAITFSESSFLSRGKMTDSQRLRLAKVILHEMAHQWFGNLVTMKWWNGLWLNESFAAFMATLATSEATEFNYAWRSFYAGEKQSAYRQDQLVTSHPIEVPIATSANAFDNIDAITYSKGASVLKQLTHLLGKETFRRGIHNYLSRHAYQNAELTDFISALSEASGKNLEQWTQDWLYQPGVNTIKTSYTCDGGKIASFTINQSADQQFPTLREQMIQIATFKNGSDGLVNIAKIPVIYKGKQTQAHDFIGTECPSFVYPNYEDWAFVKVDLDKNSFDAAKTHLSSIDDTLLRSMVWQSLWDSAKDGKISMADYLEVALANVEKETDYTILGQVLSQITSARQYLVKIFPQGSRLLNSTNDKLESIMWQQLESPNLDSNMKRRWFSYYRSIASSPAAFTKLNKMLTGELTLANLPINQSVRWDIIYQLNKNNAENGKELIATELAKDNTDSGQKSAISAEVVRPDASTKKQWLENIQSNPEKLPFSKLRTAMYSLYPDEQYTLNEETADARLQSLSAIDKANNHVFMRSYASSLIPATCTTKSVKRLSDAIANSDDLSVGTKRALLVAHQGDQRCLRIKQKLGTK